MSRVILSNGIFFINGSFEQCDLLIQKGTITEVSHHVPPLRRDLVIDLDGLCGIPALINSHDHLEFNLFPKLGNPPYRNYVEWTHDVQSNFRPEIERVLKVPLKLRLLWGAYKNLFSGVTTVVHHNDYYRQFHLNFPVDVFRNYSWMHSMKLEPFLSKKLRIADTKPFVVHLAEGTDALAREEIVTFHQLRGFSPRTVIVHGIGISDAGREILERSGASLVWCPTSNVFLFNATAPVEKLKMPIALGTDSTISGGNSLLEELRTARRLKHLTTQELVYMVTGIPAKIFGMDKGRIEIGARADILLFERKSPDPLEDLLSLRSNQIKCLFRDGCVLYADTRFEKFTPGKHQFVLVDGIEKLLAGNFARTVHRIKKYLPSLSWSNLGIDDLSFPDRGKQY